MKLIDRYKALPVQARASLWFLICAFFQKAISSMTTPIFTRLLSTSEYGQYNVFNSWLNILIIIVSLNLWGGVYMQGMVKYESERDKLGSSFQGLTITLVALWLIIYLTFHGFWNELLSLTTSQMLAMFSLICTTSAFNLWAGEQRVDFKYRELVIITLIVSLLKPALGIILVINCDDKVTARIIGLAVVELLFYARSFFIQLRKGKVFFSRTFWTYGLKFNIPLLPHYLSISILSGADRIMISNMLGDDKAGIYSLAYSISLIMTMFNNALLQTVEPWLYRKIKAQEIEVISKAAYISFGGIAVINIMLIAFAPEIVQIFAPVEYYDAIWVIPPIAMSAFFTFAYSFFATFEFYYEKKAYIVISTMVGAFLNIILNYIFITIFGYYAAGYTTLVCYILYAIFHYIFMRMICKENLDNRQPYSLFVLGTITILFISVGFGIMLTYRYQVVRYSIIILGLLILLLFRKGLLTTLKRLADMRKE